MPIVLIAAVFYLLGAWLVARRLRVDRTAGAGFWLLTAVSAVALHGLVHVLAWRAESGLDLHFFSALSLVGLGMAALTTLYAAAGRMGALGVVVFPVAALSLLGYAMSAGTVARDLDWRLELHAWLALLAYAALAIAALLAIMLWVQERALRRREFNAWLRVLPPLTELETLLFRTIWAGFVLLTATLLTGALFVQDFFAQHLIHKSVLSILSWLVFGALLVGRWRQGWRGARAVRLTLVAMALLVLAFFGSKFVLELLLQRV
ncbi:MAG TPA: cytochrome c biogenesis protein CcsA [Luteimonas sp.]|nr:cytochrome c biogenesis protein CcsA [Luteimonas sp.]